MSSRPSSDRLPRKNSTDCPHSDSLFGLHPTLDGLPILMYVKDRDLRIVSANTAFCTALGVSREELLGKPTGLLLGETGLQSELVDQEVIGTGQPRLGVVETYVSAQGPRSMLTDKVPIMDGDGVVVGLVGTSTDITKQILLQRHLRRTQEESRLVLESISEHVALQDTEHRIIWTNSAAAQSVGATAAELEGRRCYEVWAQREDPCPDCPVGRAIESGTSQQGEVRTPDGKQWMVIGSPVTDEAGVITGAVEVTLETTASKKAEEELRESEQTLRMLTDNVADVVYTMDLGFHTTYVSPSIERLVGFTPEERKKQPLHEMVTPESTNAILRALEQELRREQAGDFDPTRTLTVEVEYYRKDGTTVWTENVVKGLRDENGKLVGMLGVARDISDRWRAEQLLRESERKHRTLVTSINDVVYSLDADGIVTYISPQVEAIGGIHPHEIVGRAFSDFVHVDDLPHIAESWERLRRGTMEPSVFRVYDSAGKVRHVRTSSHPHFEYGLFAGATCSMVDITELVETEQALRESEEKYRTLFEQSVDAISLAAPDGRIMEANEAWFNLFGYTKEDLATINARDMYATPSERDHFLKRISATDVVTDEVDMRRKDGAPLNIARSVKVRRGSGEEVVGYQTVFHDITQTRRADQALRDSELRMRELAAYLEEAREKERTAIARDLHDQCGQGLTALRFDLETIMKGLRAADSQASVHLADSIKLIDRLAEEVRSLSAELRPGMLDDLGLCAAIEWHVGRFSERTAIPCELSLPEDDSAVSPVHATAVYRILQELLTNVARHSQATRVRIRLERSDGNLVLTVEDNGKGIDKKCIESKESLGLLGIRERVRPLGGGVVIGSTRGKGTTVVVQLPLVQSDMPPANDTQG